MRFLCVKQATQAKIFGQEYMLKPLDPKTENLADILVTDQNSAAELLARHPEILFEVRLECKNNPRFPRSVNRLNEIRPGDKVLILRNGGIGDHILLLPALHAFRQLFPAGCQIRLAVQKEKQILFRSNPDIDSVLSLPLRFPQLLEADCLIDFSGRQDWYDLESLPMTDAYLNFLHIDYEKIISKIPRLYSDPGIYPEISVRLDEIRREQPGRPLILLNWKASNRLRDMPAEKFLFLASRFENIRFIIAQPAEQQAAIVPLIKKYAGRITDFTSQMTSLGHYIRLIAGCAAVVSTDTAAIHLAEALGKPSLALYGPTRDQLWIRYYRNTIPLRAEYGGRTCRSPCGLTKDTTEGCPEAILLNSEYSPCLLSIDEARIAAVFEILLKSL